MLTVPAVRGAPPHLEVVRTGSIAVAAARATGLAIVNPQTNSTQRTGALDHITDCRFPLTVQRFGHVEKVNRGPLAQSNKLGPTLATMTRSRLILVVAIVALAWLGYRAVLNVGWTWPGWTGVAAVATFLAVVVALVLGIWGDELRTLGRSPRLSLTLDPAPNHFQRFTHPAGGTVEYDVRISVTNEGDFGAKNVEVVAVELMVKQADGGFSRDPVFMAMNLRRTHTGDTIAPIVHRGVPRPYDLLACYDPALQQAWKRKGLLFDLSTVISPVAAQPIVAGRPVALPDEYPSWKPAGTYRLSLAVVADGIAPVTKVVEITWTGRWWDYAADFFKNELTVRLV